MIRKRYLGLALAVLLWQPGHSSAGDGAAGASSPTEAVVNCYDETRQIVQKTKRSGCKGRIVGDAEAAEIERRRLEYMQKAFTRPPPIAPKKRRKGVGSAFFVTRDGTLVTNNHVVDGCNIVSVSTSTGETAKAEVFSSLKAIDLALVRSGLRPPGVARFATSPVPPAALPIDIVGYPDRGIPPIKPQLTSGEIVGVDDYFGAGLSIIKVKAAVRPGNSGGPVIDRWGRVVGVVFAKVNTPGVFQRTGQMVRDIGYAIPNKFALNYLHKQNVRFETAGKGAVVADALAAARPYVARIDCYD